MIEVIPFASLGRFDNEWLAARYHFSFANYRHRERDGLGPLLVWNDDTIQPGTGFPRHGHRDMEIITYVREGAITHEDHLGNVGRTEAGDVQVMSAGKGILHAEFNKEAEPARIFQIWIMPDAEGHKPRWETKAFPRARRQDGWSFWRRDARATVTRAPWRSTRTRRCWERRCRRERRSPTRSGRGGRPIWWSRAARSGSTERKSASATERWCPAKAPSPSRRSGRPNCL